MKNFFTFLILGLAVAYIIFAFSYDAGYNSAEAFFINGDNPWCEIPQADRYDEKGTHPTPCCYGEDAYMTFNEKGYCKSTTY